jgi:hypothetical protein
MEFVVLPKKWGATPTVSVFHREFWLKNACFFIKVGRFFTNHKIHQNQEFSCIYSRYSQIRGIRVEKLPTLRKPYELTSF